MKVLKTVALLAITYFLVFEAGDLYKSYTDSKSLKALKRGAAVTTELGSVCGLADCSHLQRKRR